MEQTVKKKIGVRDIMTIAAMMVINFAIAMVIGTVTLPFPAVYLYGSGLSGRYCSGLYRAVCGFQRRGKGKNATFPDIPGKHEQRLRGICARYVGDQSI